MSGQTPLLTCEGLTRRFGGLEAVKSVSFEIMPGSITALIGPNGAGKTTVFNLISGLDIPTAGSIRMEGRAISGLAPHVVAGDCRIARTFQNIRLFQGMSALDNVRAGRHARSQGEFLASILRLPAVRRQEQQSTEKALELLSFVGLSHRAGAPAGHLPYGEQRALEIARALAMEPRCLLLDEPAAGLNDAESESLMALIHRIRGLGVTIMLIEHKMNMVMNMSDQVIVLCFGEVIANGAPAEVQRDARVIEAYLGRGSTSASG